MRVEADASEYATGGVLSMKCKNKKWRSVAFISKSLNETEWNYEIHDREMLAIMLGRMEAPARRDTKQIRNLERSQEFGIFYE